MTAVSVIDGIAYGLKLLFYVLGVVLLGALFIGFGAITFTRGSSPNTYFMSATSGIVGIIVVYSGFLGLGYKMIADSVKKGMEEAR